MNFKLPPVELLSEKLRGGRVPVCEVFTVVDHTYFEG